MQSTIDHIRAATPKSRLNRRRRTNYRPSALITGLAALVGVASIMVIVYLSGKN